MDESKIHLLKRRNILKLEERVQVIHEFERTPDYLLLADKYNCYINQIKRIINNKEAVLSLYRNRKQDKNPSQMERKPRAAPNKRNALILEERVQVIRDYERTPVYLSLSRKYNCSIKQIQNIIENKETVLSYYRNGTADNKQNELQRRRLQKIAFLDKVMFEYVARAFFNHTELTDDMVSTKAMEVKKAIGIVKFYPYNIWLRNFKKAYKISSFDVNDLRKVIKFSGRKPKCYNAIALIQDVSKKELRLDQEMNVNSKDYQQVLKEISKSMLVNVNTSDNVNSGNGQDGVSVNLESSGKSSKESNQSNIDSESSSSSELPEVESYLEALRHLKVMEDFSMLKDNYRAIGLIAQLEQVLKNSPNNVELKFEAASSSELPEVECYDEALRHLEVVEKFIMLKENYRAIELIAQLEQVLNNPPNNEEFES